MLENKISWKVLKIFTQECTNDDFGMTLSFFRQGQICLLGKKANLRAKVCLLLWEEFMDFAKDFDAQVNKYSSTGEHKNSFVHQRSRSSFDL